MSTNKVTAKAAAEESRVTFDYEVDGVLYTVPRFAEHAEPVFIMTDLDLPEAARVSAVFRQYFRQECPEFYKAIGSKRFEEVGKFFEAWTNDGVEAISPLD